ncbi:MAG: LemA family protein [Beduini sp.]|uniref:LemA family protein n=1 Tax=Beduini sp. TaxID=1922300 RepID=UPI0039A2391F
MLIIIVAIIAIVVGYLVVIQRRLVHLDENCYNALSQISVQQNARWEAITSLVKLTKDYSDYEYKTLMDVVKQRQTLTKNDDVNKINEQQKIMEQAISKFQVISEAYPDLKADQVYTKTMESLKQYEDQVRYSQMVYNDTVTKFNRKIRQLPASLFASMLGFGDLKDYLEMDEAKEAMPNV